jgi:hypothetical protein
LRIPLDNVGAGDIRRHQVRRELNAVEHELHRIRDRMDHHCLGQTRHTLDDAMPPGEHAAEHRINHVFLTDDHAVHLMLQGGIALM